MQVLQDVVLHVYELQAPADQQQQQQSSGLRALSFFSQMLPSMGYGAYHTSLEVMDDRYTFAANAGIVKTRSSNEAVPPGALYKEAIPLGACCVRSRGELHEIVTKLRAVFAPNAYHLVHRNCNHFTETFATAIILQDALAEPGNHHRLKTYPDWINRLANTSKMVVSHDEDIVPCNVLVEARNAVGANEKVGWEFSSKASTSSKRNSINSTAKSSKKELTEKQKAALAKIRNKS
ncbi:Desumoylating isopeptidase 2 [Seminavis robusta]|uniref:Desumoylating isopeptidase 2 n=1 Tax=Seminavis robusta TaxID=568900 RepID=A0A9N8DGL9_9STRA|nr:Desumoylating isopeptidase 2 [Seminavis robusta]|eukprot:Sro149_g068310.1 Desumoylating isopeptidase 2 (235) ;mRNA; f:11927-12720